MRLVVPVAAGAGILDIMARLIAQRLAENIGQQVVVDNRAGASGIIGTELVARAVHPSATVRLIAVVALRRQGSPAVAEFLHDADALVVAEAARAIHDDASIPEALPALAAALAAAEDSDDDAMKDRPDSRTARASFVSVEFDLQQ